MRSLVLRRASTAFPPVDVYETDHALVFEMDLPGIDAARLNILVTGDTVLIEGSTGDEASGARARGLRYVCMERVARPFRRVLRIPVAVDPEEARAVYSGGVVTLTFPKKRDRVFKIKVERE
ncbi:MAG: Hsp20/alpha crystallin family protein [Nitrospirota bacterium]